MNYIEETNCSHQYRYDYLNSINQLIEKKQKEADQIRYKHFIEMKNNQSAYREELKKMLGWPLTEIDNEIPKIKKKFLFSENFKSGYRVQIELPIGIKFCGLYFEHDNKDTLPLVIVQHGGSGTPELCSGIWEGGSTNYNDMAMRIYEKGVNVFVPQLLLWNEERCGLKYNREQVDAKLKQLGSSITAIEIYGIMKSIDYLCLNEHVDNERIGMVGLSYGGFYTLLTTAIDTRIKAAFASSQYNNRYEYSWVDWTWFNAANTFLDNEIASLIYPRYLIIALGKEDELFNCELGEKEYKKLIKMINEHKWIEFIKFDGRHEFIKDDKEIEKFLKKLDL